MDVFDLRQQIVQDYANFARSFTRARAVDLKSQIDTIYAKDQFWPEPLLQIAPYYERGASVDELSASGEITPTTAAIFRVPDAPTLPLQLRISATEREATVHQCVGQNLFREGLMALWGGRCAITGLDVPELLRASHAKPWADSNDVERLNVCNGLLLAAHWDAAFDAGLVTVSPDGAVLASPSQSDAVWGMLCLSDALKLKLQPQHAPTWRGTGSGCFGWGDACAGSYQTNLLTSENQ